MNQMRIYNMINNIEKNPLISSEVQCTGIREDLINEIIRKYKCLYITNFNGFRKQTDQMIRILYKNMNNKLFSKLVSEIERLYE